MTRLIDLKEQMLKVLSAAQKERKARPEYVDFVNAWGHKVKEPEWAIHELNVMFAEVNRRRAENGLAPISLVDVQKVESMACGHSDYSSKFALYCAELTFKPQEQIQP